MENGKEVSELEVALGLVFKEITVREGTSREETVRVEEFEMEQIPRLTALVKGLVGMFISDEVSDESLMQSGETGIKFLMLATGKPREWFNKMSLKDGLGLYSALIETNKSFFPQIGKFTDLINLLTDAVAPTAPTQSDLNGGRS